jgi:CBS-domain-containing membrane protein
MSVYPIVYIRYRAQKMARKLKMKKPVVMGAALFLTLLISLFVTMLLLKITDYGITVASFGATIFMMLSKKKVRNKQIFGAYFVATVTGYLSSRISGHTTLNLALAAVSSIALMTVLEFQHTPAIGIAVAMVLNKFSFLVDFAVLLCILIIISLVLFLRIVMTSPEKISRFIEIEEDRIKWRFQQREARKYITLKSEAKYLKTQP